MVDNIKLFKLNDKIDIYSKDENKTAGLIYDIKDEKIYVSISADDDSFKLMEIGEEVSSIIYSKNNVTSFEAVVTDRLFINFPIYELSNISNFKRIQRRDNIRVQFTQNLLYTDNKILLEQDLKREDIKETLETIKKYLKDGMLLDLSAGGLKLSIKEDLAIGTKLIFVLNIEDDDIILKGQIVHKDINLVPKQTAYLYGIKFIDIEEDEQEKIIRYLFVIMRKNRIK